MQIFQTLKKQQGFQKNYGCLTSSYDLQEIIIIINLEQNNNIFVIFLDTSNAFDTV